MGKIDMPKSTLEFGEVSYFVDISAGYSHSLAIDSNGKLHVVFEREAREFLFILSPKKVEVDEFPELNDLTIGDLEGMIPALEEELDTIQQKRNYMQLERDQVATFYEITKRDTEKVGFGN